MHTLIIPLDSEDIERLISALDDAIDGIEAAAVRMVIFQIEAPTERARQLAQLIHSGAQSCIRRCPICARRKLPLVTEHIKEINTIENNGDRVLREALVDIVNDKEDLQFDSLEGDLRDAGEAHRPDGRHRRRDAAGGYGNG